MKAKAVNQEQFSLHEPKPYSHKFMCTTQYIY